MARTKRPYGTGSVIALKGGTAIRWWETIVGEDGMARREMQYENLGDVTKKEAEGRLADKQHAARRNGPRRELAIPLFSEVAERYSRDILALAKFSTRTVRKTILDTHLIPRFGSMLLSDLTTATIQRFFTELREAGYFQAGVRQEYSPHMLHDVRSVLRGVMKSALEWYRLPADPQTAQPFNPVIGVKLPQLKCKRVKWALTAEQAGQLIGRLHGKAKVMVALAITGGMRRGELLALRLRHISESIDADNQRFGVIRVDEASYLSHIDTPKTEAGTRTIDVHPWVFALILDWITRSRKRKPDDLVFGTRTNRLENSNNILRRHVFPACDAIGLPRATWLTFRRTFQTFAHNEGIPARTIADIVGHADVGTQFIYIQSEASMKRVAADRIGNKLCKIVQIVEQENALVN